MEVKREYHFNDLESYEIKSLVENMLLTFFQNKKECLFNSDLDIDFVNCKIKLLEKILKELNK